MRALPIGNILGLPSFSVVLPPSLPFLSDHQTVQHRSGSSVSDESTDLVIHILLESGWMTGLL